jgi:copper chaperone CopZ
MNKKIMITLLAALFFTALVSQAQFTKATLQATGLTCAMCNNAINKALQKVPFVESVKSDIKNSAFTMVFRSGARVEIDELKKAVEDAGFSIGSLKLVGSFSDLALAPDKHIKIGESNFHFLNVKEQVLSGEQTITVVDKNYITEKQFKKISTSTKMKCIQTGKTADCCNKDGLAEGERVYHVTIG